jgi:CheY-like chemotaxis protein
MPAGGSLNIVARRPNAGETFPFGVVPNPESFIQISLTDTGCGIPADIIGNVFDPLFTTKRNGGTGLGLAVVHQIVTNHGAVIFVESEPGLGTTFHTFFPVAVTEPSVEPAPIAPLPLTGPARVLIIDDEPAVAEGLEEVLIEEGNITAIAHTAASGEAKAATFQPDFALVDVGLPDANGADLAMRLRTNFPELRVVIISGHADASGILVDDPNVQFLQKPFPIASLLQVLKKLEGGRPA